MSLGLWVCEFMLIKFVRVVCMSWVLIYVVIWASEEYSGFETIEDLIMCDKTHGEKNIIFLSSYLIFITSKLGEEYLFHLPLLIFKTSK